MKIFKKWNNRVVIIQGLSSRALSSDFLRMEVNFSLKKYPNEERLALFIRLISITNETF